MTFAQGKAIQASLEADVKNHSVTLWAFPRGAMGVTPDSVKATPEWQTAKRNYAVAFSKLRAFNSEFIKTFKRELTAERNARTVSHP